MYVSALPLTNISLLLVSQSTFCLNELQSDMENKVLGSNMALYVILQLLQWFQ